MVMQWTWVDGLLIEIFVGSCVCVCVRNKWRSIKAIAKAMLINLTNKSLFIGWPEENEPCPPPFVDVKLLLNCDENDVVDVIARLDEDFCTVWAWMTWRAPPFGVIVWRMFICLCWEWTPFDVWMFCDKLCGENVKRMEDGWEKRDHAVRKMKKHVKQELAGDFQKRQFRWRIQRHERARRGQTWIAFFSCWASTFRMVNLILL